jgi:hypothetical protein
LRRGRGETNRPRRGRPIATAYRQIGTTNIRPRALEGTAVARGSKLTDMIDIG